MGPGEIKKGGKKKKEREGKKIKKQVSRQSGKTAWPPASFERRGSGTALGQGVEGKQADGKGRPEERGRRGAGRLTLPGTGRAAPAEQRGDRASDGRLTARECKATAIRKHAAPHRKGRDPLA